MANINSFDYWMDQLANRTEGTKVHYARYLRRFCEWVTKSPDELIEMQKITKNHTEDLRENRVLEGKVRAFMKHLEDEGKSISTQKLAYAGILSFFELNLYPLDMRPQDRPNGEARGSRIPEKQEIVKLVNAAKSRTYRAAILALKDSGLRISDLVQLRWDDLEDLGEGFWSWKILSKKRKIQATPFLGPEATEALKLLDRKSKRVFPINAHSLSNAMVQIIASTGLKDVTAHGLRKYFNVELQAARVPREWRYQMMGKKTGAYDENRLTKLFTAYREAYNNLRVYGAGVNAEVEKLKKSLEELRAENQELRQRLNGYTLSNDQVAELLRRIEKLEKQAQKQK